MAAKVPVALYSGEIETLASGDFIPIANGGTGATTQGGAQTALGLAIGTNVQAWDADLDAIVAFASTGIAVRTGSNTWAQRTLTGTSNQVTVTNGDGSGGNPTLSLPSGLIAPGSVTATTYFATSVSNTISAAGTTQGTATALTSDINRVTSSTAGTQIGVILPANSVGRSITVINDSANDINVYPPTSSAIDGAGTNTAVTLKTGSQVIYSTTTSTLYSTVRPSLVAGTGITVTPGNGVSTIANAGVTSLSGTANQISASASTGSVTLSLPSALTVPGSLTVTSALNLSTTTGISAAGSTQGTATAITTDINIVSTVGASQGVVLPTATAGRVLKVTNLGANALSIYPASGASIDALSANAATTLAVGMSIEIMATSTTVWKTQLISLPRITVGTVAPSNPQVGDLWIDTN